MDPSKRLTAVVLALGTIVLLSAIVLGQVIGYRGLNESTELHPVLLPTALITPEPLQTGGGAYGPSWQRSQTLAAAPDPAFPDPRVPPVPLPTPLPTPKPKPTHHPTPTPNPNIPIWDRSPFPSPLPTPSVSAEPTEPAPSDEASPKPR